MTKTKKRRQCVCKRQLVCTCSTAGPLRSPRLCAAQLKRCCLPSAVAAYNVSAVPLLDPHPHPARRIIISSSMSSEAAEQKRVIVFVSSISANKEVKQQQQRVLQTLEVKRIPFETRDIAVDQEAKRDFRRLMRIHDPRATTPQIFNGDTHCGNYEAFYWAVEEETLKVFLLLEPPALNKPAAATAPQQPDGQTPTVNADTQPAVTTADASSSASDSEAAAAAAAVETKQTSDTAQDENDATPVAPAVPPPPRPPPPTPPSACAAVIGDVKPNTIANTSNVTNAETSD